MTADKIIKTALASYLEASKEGARDPLAKIGGFQSQRNKSAVYREQGRSMRGKDALWAGERVNYCAGVFRCVRQDARIAQSMAAQCVPPVNCTELAQVVDAATTRLQYMDTWARKSDDSDALPFAGNRDLFWRHVDKVRELVQRIGDEVAARRTSLYSRLCDATYGKPAVALAA